MSLAVLCSGQGGQNPSMFDIVEAEPDAGPLIAQASACAGFDVVAATRRTDAGPSMFDNAIAQPLICAFQDIVWSLLAPRLTAAGVSMSLCAGYSVGELASHACAGSLSSADTIALARLRAAVMDDASGTDDGLAAVRGLSRRELDALVASSGAFVAIVNGDDHFVVGGVASALDALVHSVDARGGTAQRLPVRVAAHTPLLRTAVDPFRAGLERRTWMAPTVPVVAGIDGAMVRDRALAIDALARQIAEPVRWADCMDGLVERGATTCLELGPGNALARMIRDRHPQLAARSVADFRSLGAVIAWVARADR